MNNSAEPNGGYPQYAQGAKPTEGDVTFSQINVSIDFAAT
jgi:hypothetical protein